MYGMKSLARSLKRLIGQGAYDQTVLNSMRDAWNERARHNARHFIATAQQEWSDEEFFASGADEVADLVLNDLVLICGGRNPTDMRALEIGCGGGRMTMALSNIFGHVDGVDISTEMIAQARAALKSQANVELHCTNGSDLSIFPNESFDFAISAVVFQHIPKRVVVENYIQETWRVLRPGSLFKFQLQGHSIEEEDADTWIGVGFSEKQMQEIARRTGFQLKASRGAGTQYYWLSFYKPGP
jgi:SAM-dependent methyltransferase